MNRPDLLAVLADARSAGFLGPGPVEDHVEHALGFAEALPPTAARVVDLGSGGGVPGLVLADARPEDTLLLLDSQQRRARFLNDAVARLGLGARVGVYAGRVERAGRDAAQRATYDAAVARAFGPPAVTAEAAAPLLRVGGVLVVSEPPVAAADRWPTAPLAELGLVPRHRYATAAGHYQVLDQRRLCSDRFPRRDGIAAKRPLFDVSRETLD